MSVEKSCLLLSLLIAGFVTGCGGAMNYSAANLPTEDTSSASADSNNRTLLTPAATPIPTATPYVVQGKLEIRDVTKEAKGFLLWKKLEVKGRVFNSGSQPLSGTLQIAFSKAGKAGSNQTAAINNLAPGQSFPFDLTSAENADAGDLSILGQR